MSLSAGGRVMAREREDDREKTRSVDSDGAEKPPAEDRPYLIVLKGPAVGDVYRIDRTMTIGRGDGADIRVPDDDVSREHARIVAGNLGVLLSDLRSDNGTAVLRKPFSVDELLRQVDRVLLPSCPGQASHGACQLRVRPREAAVRSMTTTPRTQG